MVGITKPNEDISYRLKNVDFGTYLELRERDGSLVLRPEKDSRLSQFFVFKPVGNGSSYTIKSAPYDGQNDQDASAILQGDVGKPITVDQRGTALLSNWVVAGPGLLPGQVYIYAFTANRTPALIYSTNTQELLVDTDPSIQTYRSFSTTKLADNYRWEIVEVNSSSLPDGDNDNYRIRTLLGTLLTVDTNGTVVVADGNSTSNRHWTILLAPGNGNVTIYNIETRKYLTPEKQNGIWVISMSDKKQIWQIQASSDFTYSIYVSLKIDESTKTLFSLAVGQGKAILKPKKLAHNQIWFLEPENADLGSATGIAPLPLTQKPDQTPSDVVPGLAPGRYKIKSTSKNALYIYSYDYPGISSPQLSPQPSAMLDAGNSYYKSIFEVAKYGTGVMITNPSSGAGRKLVLAASSGVPNIQISQSDNPYVWNLAKSKKPGRTYVIRDSATNKGLFCPVTTSSNNLTLLDEDEDSSFFVWEFIPVQA